MMSAQSPVDSQHFPAQNPADDKVEEIKLDDGDVAVITAKDVDVDDPKETDKLMQANGDSDSIPPNSDVYETTVIAADDPGNKKGAKVRLQNLKQWRPNVKMPQKPNMKMPNFRSGDKKQKAGAVDEKESADVATDGEPGAEQTSPPGPRVKKDYWKPLKVGGKHPLASYSSSEEEEEELPEGKKRKPRILRTKHLDMENRDPHGNNDFLKDLVFSEVFGEPEPTTHSFDKIWVLSYKIYAGTKLWFYRFLTLIFAIPAAIFWGIVFALASFVSIWCCVPCLKCCRVEVGCIGQAYRIFLENFWAPFFSALGRVFSFIRVFNGRSNEQISLDYEKDPVHIA